MTISLPAIVVVRAGGVVDRFASSFILTRRNNATKQIRHALRCLFVVCSASAHFSGGQQWGGAPPKSFTYDRARGPSQIVWDFIDPYRVPKAARRAAADLRLPLRLRRP